MPGKLVELNWGVANDAGRDPHGSSLLDRTAVAWVTLAVLVVLTLMLARDAQRDVEQRAHDQFLFLVAEATDRLVDRMESYEQVLRGGVALFEAEGLVSRAAWRTYVDALKLDEYLPGIQGTGFALVIPKAALAEHERAVRAEGFPYYSVDPPGERELYTSIIYLEPFTGRNLRAFGYDMYAEPVRREAMQQARDSGHAALSRKVQLVQETASGVQAGFLMYLPVYRSGLPRATVAQRRDAILGFVYSPFRAADLIHGIFALPGRETHIELFDGQPDPVNLLYSSLTDNRPGRFVVDRELEIAGRPWTARFHSSRRFDNDQASTRPWILLFGGLTLDLLLFAVLYMNANHRRAMRTAAIELARSRESFRSLVENLPGAVFRSGIGASDGAHVSSGIEAITGEPPERFLSGKTSFEQMIHPEDKAEVRKVLDKAIAQRSTYRVEYRVRRRDGTTRWVAENGRIIVDEAGRPLWLDGVMFDIDDRKRAEIAIRELAFNDPLTGLPNRRLLLDRLEHQLASSSRTGWHGAILFMDLDNFKTINDTLGHAIGDLLLMEVANRLWTHVREDDTVARLGGDEFVVMLDANATSREDAQAAAMDVGNKILAELNRPYQLGGHTIESAASIGVTVFRGHDASADQLLRRADRAMYQAKSQGRNCVVFFD